MNDSGKNHDESLPLGDLARIDKVCTKFEESWKAGNPDRIEELLRGFEGQVRAKLLLELLLLEFEYRSASGAEVPFDEYRGRFPDDLEILGQAIEQASHDVTILTPGQSVDRRLVPERIRYLGDYEILEEIARGGMGIVFKARQIPLGRIVAVKMMLSGQFSSEEQIARFKREARLAAKLQHPNIVAVHEVGQHEGLPYFSMDYVDGPSLSEMVRDNPLPPRDAARYVQVAAATVHKVHEEGILHRDIKPSNILIDREDRVRMTDFGLGRALEAEVTLTPTASGVGTPSYMPPEQVVGNKALIGVQSDVYSLGAVLYELLTGRPPFAAATPIETMHQVKTKEPVSPRVLNPDVPKDLETICLKCLEKEPHKRYGTAEELANDLQRFLEGRPVLARPVGSTSKAWRWMKRNPVVTALTALSVLLLVSGTGISTYFAIEADQRATAEGIAKADVQKKASALANRTRELEGQLHVSTALRISDQAQNTASDYPVRSLLLAVRAAEETLEHDGTLLPEAHQCLRDGLERVGGLPLVGHKVAISPDSRWLITGGRGMMTRLWDLTAEDPISSAQVLEHDGRLLSVAFSPDSRWLVTRRSDKTARLWDFTADNPVSSAMVLEHDDHLLSVSFSPDSRWLVIPSLNRTARLWDLEAPNPAKSAIVLSGRENQVIAWAISADSHWLVTHAGGKIARLWDLTANDPSLNRLTLISYEHYAVYTTLESLAVSPDSHWLAISCDNTATLWDLTADPPASSPYVLEGASIAFSPDSRWLVTGEDDKTKRLWDLTASDPKCIVLRGHEGVLRSVAISPDSHWLVTGGDNKSAQLWDLTADDPAVPVRVLRGHKGFGRIIAFSPNSRWLVTGYRGQSSPYETCLLWDLTTDVLPVSAYELHGHEAYVTSVAISPDSRWLITGSADKTTRLWDLNAPDPVKSAVVFRGHENPVSALAISPDSRWLVTSSEDKAARLWNLVPDEPVYSLRMHHKPLMKMLQPSIAISPDSHWLVIGGVGYFEPIPIVRHGELTFRNQRLCVPGCFGIMLDLNAANPATSVYELREHSGVITSVACSSNNRWVITGSSDRTARLWDIKSDHPATSAHVLRGHRDQVSSVAFSSDNRWVVTGSDDSTARLWDLTADDPASQSIVLRGHEGKVSSVAISPDNRWLVTGSEDKTVRLWRLTGERPGSLAYVLQGHDGRVLSVAFCPDSRWVVTGSDDKTVRMWNLTAEDPASDSIVFRGHEGVVSSVTISPDGRWLVTVSRGNVRMWDLTLDAPAALPVLLRGHEKGVIAVTFSPDSRSLVTFGGDETVRRWDLNINSLIDRARRVAGRELTPDERKLYHLD